MIDHLIATILLAIASINDIKTKEVPDYISYMLITLGVFLLIFKFINGTFEILQIPLIIFFIAVAISLYKSGLWGGGDMLLLIAISLLFDFNQLIDFFINFAIISSFYSAIVNFALINKKLAFLSLFSLLLLYFKPLGLLVTLTIFLVLTLIFRKKIEKKLIKEIEIGKLTWGDWILEDLIIGNNLFIKKKEEGISLEDLEKIKRLPKKLKKLKVKVKEGIPLAPAFLISYILTYLLNNNLIFLLFS